MKKIRWRGTVGIMWALAMFGSLPAPSRAAYQPGKIVHKQGYAMVPLTFYRDTNSLFVDCQINGHAVTLILDTGSPTTILPLSQGVHLGLLPALAKDGPHRGTRELEINGERALLAVAKEFAIGPVKSINVPVAEVKAISSRFFRGPLAGMHIDGLLGADFLIAHGAVIDVQRHELLFRLDAHVPDAVDHPLRAAGWTAIPFMNGATKIFVPAQLEGKDAELIVDTGAPYTNLSARFCREVGIQGSFLTFAGGVMFNGDREESQGKVKDFRVGTYTMRDQTLAVSPSLDRVLPKMSWQGKPVAGLLGTDFLGNHLAFIDYQNHTLYLKKP